MFRTHSFKRGPCDFQKMLQAYQVEDNSHSRKVVKVCVTDFWIRRWLTYEFLHRISLYLA
jgi:hypothetical protein